MEKEVIYSKYKSPPQKRGTLEGGIFYRDATPLVWKRFISLEVDVIQQLLGRCQKMSFGIRGKKDRIVVDFEKFKNAKIINTGVPDKRAQHFFDTEEKRIPLEKGQLDLFK